MPEDDAYVGAHKTVAKMLTDKAKTDNLESEQLFELLAEEEGVGQPATKLSEVSIGVIARVLTQMEECPL